MPNYYTFDPEESASSYAPGANPEMPDTTTMVNQTGHFDTPATDAANAAPAPYHNPDYSVDFSQHAGVGTGAGGNSGSGGISEFISQLGESLGLSGIPAALAEKLGFGGDQKKALFGKDGIINANAEAFKVLGTGIFSAQQAKAKREEEERLRSRAGEDRAQRNSAVAGQRQYGLINSARKFVNEGVK